jgi:hypothetical protein
VRYLGKRKGAVLIIVLGVLAVLALLATTFATLQATERQVAQNYLDTVRAKLLAQTGVQEAAARLKEFFPSRYFDTGGLLTGNPPRPWKWWGKDKAPYETAEPNPLDKLEESTNPSFAIEISSTTGQVKNPQDPFRDGVTPKQLTIENVSVGLSGASTSGRYALHGDNYALKVSDLSGRIYVNDGLDGGPNGSVSQNLKRILNLLGRQINAAQLGDKILQNRPPTGYRSEQDLLKALGFDDVMYNRVKEFVTVYAWVDRNVANPVPLSPVVADRMRAATGVTYFRGNPPLYRFGSSRDSFGKEIMPPPYNFNTSPPLGPDAQQIRIWGQDSLNPQWIEIVSRAPVNVNAASREVLISLLTDLKGFFVSDRRRNNPRWKGDLYLSFKQQNMLGPSGTSGDEFGYLMETLPIVGPGGTQADGISAFDLANEIIACRNRSISRWANYGDTALYPWAGPFQTWHQFYAFIDNLVAKFSNTGMIKDGLLKDMRPIYYDYQEEVDDPSGYGGLVPSAVQRNYGCQGIADVIKANFNPNLQLNILNPDENMFLVVDKTQLMCNSNEFAFMPTGYFEIESLGRVLRPYDPQTTDSYLGNNHLVAQAKVTAVYKIYEMYRETSQKQFYAGTLTRSTGAAETNNGHSLEIGPEADNGVFPGNLDDTGHVPDNEWGGYIALPTVGGCAHAGGLKLPNSLVRTQDMASSPQFNATAHGHFQFDFDLCNHPYNRSELGHAQIANDPVVNYGSYVGGQLTSFGRPYNPTQGGVGGLYPRECRSFRQIQNKNGTMNTPFIGAYPPSDLRIDGGYVERHCAPSYFANWGANGLFGDPAKTLAKGMVSFWFKPNFCPDRTGKVRTLWDYGRFHQSCSQNVNVWPFALWFFPSHYTVTTAETNGPKYWHNNVGQFLPSSLCWGTKQWHDIPQDHEFGNLTTCLNHLDHIIEGYSCAGLSPLRGHRWMNVTMQWGLNKAWYQDDSYNKLYVNGTTGFSTFTYTTMTGGWSAGYDFMEYWNKHDGGENNQIRMGAPSLICQAARSVATANGAYRGNHTGDQTIDELYIWNTDRGALPTVLWQRGRYYKPLDTSYGEGLFTSQAMNFQGMSPRVPPPASTVSAPGGSGMGGGSGSGGGKGVGQTVPPVVNQIRILGVSWTWYGEGLFPAGTPQAGQPALYDYNKNPQMTVGNPTPTIQPQIHVGITDGTMKYGPFDNDGFSGIQAPDGSVPIMQNLTDLHYFAQFRLKGATLNTVLLTTPVLDDVTVFWDDNQSHLLSYVFDNRSW